MNKDDWSTVVGWVGIVYIPIAILIVIIFLLVSYYEHRIGRGVDMHVEETLVVPVSA